MKPLRRLLGLAYALYKAFTFQYCLAIKKHRNSEKIIALYFHNISNKKFEKILKWINRCKFNLLTQDDLIDFLTKNKEIKGGIFITFDDGWHSNLELIPVIEKYKCPITFFLSTRSIFNNEVFWPLTYELYFKHRVDNTFHSLTYNQKLLLIDYLGNLQEFKCKKSTFNAEEAKILGLHPLISFGLHSHNHVSLVNCSEEEIQKELDLNLRFIRLIYPNHIKSFAYPYGLTNDNNQKTFKERNISIAMVTGNKPILKTSNKYLLPRYGFNNGTLLENYCRILDCW